MAQPIPADFRLQPGEVTTEEEKRIVAEHLDKALEKYEHLTPDRLAELVATYEQLTGHKPANYEQFADVGTFVVAFRHRDKNSPTAMSEFCESPFRDKPYVGKYVIGAIDKIQAAAVVVVKGQRGITQCVDELKKEPRIQIDFALPLSDFMRSPEWKAALEGQTVIEELPSNYVQAFEQLYRTIGSDCAYFEVKQIDWKAVGEVLLPRSPRDLQRQSISRLPG